MPKKPSSVFVFIQDPANTTVMPPGVPDTNVKAWRIALTDDVDIETVVSQLYAQQPISSIIYVVEDTKMTAYKVGVALEAIEDPRLDALDDEDHRVAGPPQPPIRA